MLWICLALLIVAGIAAFAAGDAGTIGGFDGDTIAAVTASLALLIFIGSSVVGSYQGRIKGAARDLSIWLGLALALIVGYSFREEAGFVANRVAGELMPPGQTLSVGADADSRQAVRIRKRPDGHFAARARVNGSTITLLVDTGASSVMLKSSDARAAGIDLSRLVYSTPIQTANGSTFAASIRLSEIEVGAIVVRNVDALVAKPGTLRESLLGMSFLRQLRSYEFSREFLTLRS